MWLTDAPWLRVGLLDRSRPRGRSVSAPRLRFKMPVAGRMAVPDQFIGADRRVGQASRRADNIDGSRAYSGARMASRRVIPRPPSIDFHDEGMPRSTWRVPVSSVRFHFPGQMETGPSGRSKRDESADLCVNSGCGTRSDRLDTRWPHPGAPRSRATLPGRLDRNGASRHVSEWLSVCGRGSRTGHLRATSETRYQAGGALSVSAYLGRERLSFAPSPPLH